MKIILVIVLCGFASVATAASTIVPTNAPAHIELNDQFDAPQELSFPNTNITFLTIADYKGSQQIPAWIAPVQQRFGTRVDIRGIADLSTVPRMFRGSVRGQFQKTRTHPVMLDWSGATVNAFTYEPNQANVLVLDRHGRILKRLAGVASENALRDICTALDAALADVEK